MNKIIIIFALILSGLAAFFGYDLITVMADILRGIDKDFGDENLH